jgi:protoporphyrinogen oxidase
MKVGIIGAGFGGLAAAYELAKQGVDVTVFESGDKPGGLAIGFKEKSWKWSLEAHYHHWFTNDSAVLELAREIGHPVITIRPKTSTYYDGKIYQVDSKRYVN